MHLNDFINTYPGREKIQDIIVAVKQWGLKHMYVQLYRRIPCPLGEGLYTASSSAIDRLPESRNVSEYREGQSFQINN